ncbi:MAG: hypothetical protein UR66_C0017G0014 [Candidatus Moranbacteria bacterium GW2011_GWE1_35_17]|nr:MAG: hypothetical protein UR66_C0017G0014 [Candidatus Moranbacteria bacterium GW2011_GWE1_35_17]KKP89570.1 MAG: hypothetical protein UR95_C0007G0106 [Parcubacteria group bacterium GW2011_GWC1_36_108]
MSKNNQPLVSIVSSNYNFEKFIPYFMESVLSQTYKNWELIVTDDCSTDKSFEILKSYEKKDKRIKILQNDKNRHVCHTLNNSFRSAKGEYVCIISCDDAFMPEKIVHDVDFMEKNKKIGVLYGQLFLMDESNTLHGKYCFESLQEFNSAGLLRRMFLLGNQCIAPGMFIRKEVVNKIGFLNPLLKMTQDYDYHVRLLFNTEPAFNNVPLTKYRRMSDNSNLSSYSVQTTINSEINETFFVLNNYLQNIKDYSLLSKIFPEVVEFGPADNYLIPYYLGRIAINSEKKHIKSFGIQTLYSFMLDDNNAKYLEDKTGYLIKDFMDVLSKNKIYCNLIEKEDKEKRNIYRRTKTKLYKIKLYIKKLF